MSKHRKEAKQAGKFVIVGALGTIVDAGTLYILTRSFHIGLLVAQAGSFSVAVVHNFILNRYWTFEKAGKHEMHIQMLRYYGANLVGLIIRSGIIAAVSKPFTQLSHRYHIGPFTPQFLADYASLGLAIAIVFIWNFLVSRFWIFHPAPDESA